MPITIELLQAKTEAEETLATATKEKEKLTQLLNCALDRAQALEAEIEILNLKIPEFEKEMTQKCIANSKPFWRNYHSCISS